MNEPTAPTNRLTLEAVINGLADHLTRTPDEVNMTVKALLTTLVDHPHKAPYVLRLLTMALAPADDKPALCLVSNIHTLPGRDSQIATLTTTKWCNA